MRELIITNKPIRHRKEQAFLSFSMKLKDGKNEKHCSIGVFQVLNPKHDYYGQWTLSALFYDSSFTIFFDTKEEAIKEAEKYLEKMKMEYQTGARNWWSGRMKVSA